MPEEINRIVTDAIADLLCSRLTVFVCVVELVVLALERAAVEIHHLTEALQRSLKLLLRLFLRVARVLHTIHQNVALVKADLFQSAVVRALTAAQQQRCADGQPEMDLR